MRIPVATYRLQFGDDVGFRQARGLVGYLEALGISHVYASPILAARLGTSGYHVVDPTRLDPTLGTRAEFDGFTDELRSRDMGLLLDIVPNHMSASADNPWWMDVLRRGRASASATFFDIDWDRHDGKVLVPALDAPLEEVLRRGDLAAGVEAGEPVIRHHDRMFPVDPSTISGAGTLSELLERQHYVLASWRDAAGEINYRRFFDISDLVALRQEDPKVFDATHSLILELVREGRVTGLRVDHVDGLRDPAAYLERLRKAVGEDVPIYVEKILEPGEELPADWPVQGTTGYEFAAAVSDLFVDPDGYAALQASTGELTGRPDSFEELAAAKKRQVLEELFSGQARMLVVALRRALGRRESSEPGLSEALLEITARLPVYRTYIRNRRIAPSDRRFIERAVRMARQHVKRDKRATVDAVASVLLLKRGGPKALDFVMRWQQLTGSMTAKGVEDTAFYDYPVLLSRDELGADPGEPPGGLAEFHRLNRERARNRPLGLSATSTHDSKRSEDVRARIAPISEVADPWRKAVKRWSRLTTAMKQTVEGEAVPDPSEELLLYQTLVGLWPLATQGEFPERIEEHVLKAAREAKVHTSWLDPEEKHEEALAAFVRAVLGPDGGPFREDLEAFQERMARAGVVNALAQALLKIAAPGVPDFYRGTERWFLRLVDPDNRRRVDFPALESALRDLPEPHGGPRPIKGLLSSWEDGRIKLHVVRAALAVRRDHPDVFARGSYVPLEATGGRGEHVVAFARRHRQQWVVAVAPRLTLRASRAFPLGRRAWGSDSLTLPKSAPDSWVNPLTGEHCSSDDGSVLLADVFSTLPIALLISSTNAGKS